ncbi:MAG TPA: hypothetical protein VER79_07025 [Candidatus Limnocylindrales bacterium]|nr:hypothetical protein [Candidatus Limnocylindrales bacterium]
MTGVAQIGIAIGALGLMLASLGLFPGLTGVAPASGFGTIQYTAVLLGFALLTLGALTYAKFTLYVGRAANLAQQIGIRLTLTGIVAAGLAGFSDFLGFGSHLPTATSQVYLGEVQITGAILGFACAFLGVFLYALMGTPPPDGD